MNFKKIIVANWKMNPQSLKEGEELFDFVKKEIKKYKEIGLILCPPFLYLQKFKEKLKGNGLEENNLKLGAQNCHWKEKGAFTGEISPLMLKNLGVDYIIIGHSERRIIMKENDEMTNKKLNAVLKTGLTPIFAFGEKEKEDDYKNIILNQLKSGLEGLKQKEIEMVIFAYEPIWAIGSGKSDTPENTLEIIDLIKRFLNEKYKIKEKNKFLYGGSVNSKNVADFITKEEINGVLVGGASVDKEEFAKIMEIVSLAK